MLNPVFFWCAQVAMFTVGFTSGVLACWRLAQIREAKERERRRGTATE